MAIASIGTGGSGANATSSTNFSFNASPAATISGTNRFAILVVACDNTTTTDATSNDVTTVTNTRGGTWTKLAEFTNGNGAAAAGVTTAAFLYDPGAAGELRSGDPVTINFDSARVEKTASLWVFSKAAGVPIVQNATAITNGVDAANGFGSVAFTGLPSLERLYFRALGKEANSTTQITPSTSFTAITANRSSATANAILVRGEFRVVTATAQTSNPTLAQTGDTAGIFLALVEGTNTTLPQATRFDNTNTFFAATLTQSGGTTSLTQNARFNDGDTFYAATVTVGAVVLAPNRFDNTNTFYAATVSQSGAAQSLTADLFTNSSTFYSAALVGSIPLNQTARFDNASTFNTSTLTVGPVTLTQNTSFNNTSIFNAATLTVGPVTLSQGTRFDNLATFYPATASVGGASLVQNVPFNNTSTFYAAAITTGPVTLTQNARFNNISTFSPASVSTGPFGLVQNTRLNNAQSFYTAALNQTTNLVANRLNNTQTFYAASVAGVTPIFPPFFIDGDTFHAPTVSQRLFANTFGNANTFFPASISGGEQTGFITGGTVVRPRRNPFKTAILWDFYKTEKEEQIDGETFVVTAMAKGEIGQFSAFGEISSEARVDFVQAQADVVIVQARSGWNDPTDEELISLISMAF